MVDRNLPSPLLLHEAEVGVRTALVYNNVFAGRMALARISRRAVPGATAQHLARIAAASRELSAAIDDVLAAARPQLAADAGAMAVETCRREMVIPWTQATPVRHLVLVRAPDPKQAVAERFSRPGS